METKRYRLTRVIPGIGGPGDVVELTEDEYAMAYKNVTLTMIDDGKVSEEDARVLEEFDRKRDELELFLRDTVGLSQNRVTRVLMGYNSKEELFADKDMNRYGSLTRDAIAKHRPKDKKTKKKKESDK